MAEGFPATGSCPDPPSLGDWEAEVRQILLRLTNAASTDPRIYEVAPVESIISYHWNLFNSRKHPSVPSLSEKVYHDISGHKVSTGNVEVL